MAFLFYLTIGLIFNDSDSVQQKLSSRFSLESQKSFAPSTAGLKQSLTTVSSSMVASPKSKILVAAGVTLCFLVVAALVVALVLLSRPGVDQTLIEEDGNQVAPNNQTGGRSNSSVDPDSDSKKKSPIPLIDILVPVALLLGVIVFGVGASYKLWQWRRNHLSMNINNNKGQDVCNGDLESNDMICIKPESPIEKKVEQPDQPVPGKLEKVENDDTVNAKVLPEMPLPMNADSDKIQVKKDDIFGTGWEYFEDCRKDHTFDEVDNIELLKHVIKGNAKQLLEQAPEKKVECDSTVTVLIPNKDSKIYRPVEVNAKTASEVCVQLRKIYGAQPIVKDIFMVRESSTLGDFVINTIDNLVNEIENDAKAQNKSKKDIEDELYALYKELEELARGVKDIPDDK